MPFARRAVTGALALTVAFALAACSPQDSGNNTLADRKSESPTPKATPPAGGGGAVDVEAKDNEFVPKQITAKAGAITFEVHNSGAAPHTFTIRDLKVDQAIQAGQHTEVKITGVAPGTYKLICIYHESIGMVGEVTVT